MVCAGVGYLQLPAVTRKVCLAGLALGVLLQRDAALGAALPALLDGYQLNAEAEEAVKKETKATIRCFPLQGQEAAEGKACFYSGKPATHMALFARAF